MASRVATATVFLAALVAQVAPASSKLQVVRTTLGARGDGPSWQYVSKFGFGVGVSEFRARVRQVRGEGEAQVGGAQLSLESFLDERWPEVEAIEDPCRRRLPGEQVSHKFTSHDGVKGWAFLTFRLALFAWFLLAARATAASEGLKLRAFLRRFCLAASVYFLAYPVAMLLLPIFAPCWRRAVLEFMLMVTRICANLWLSSLFLGRGAYFEVSSLGATLLLGGSRSCSRFLKGD